MATPVVLTTGARPITPVESGGVPMTPVDTLGEPVTVVDTLGEPVVLINNDGTPAFLAYSAKTYLGGVAPYHWLDFVNNRALYAGADVGNVTGATGYSFTRASDGYYTNADGTLTLFGSGALRRGDRGVLIEGSRTNLITYSQQFDDAAWSKAGTVTVTPNAIEAPDGTLTADRIQMTATTQYTANAQQLLAISGGTASKSFVVSVWLRATSGTATMALKNTHGGVADNFSDLTLTTTWTRYTFAVTNSASAGTGNQITGLTNGASGNAADFYAWGFQVENAGFASSYIPTVAAAATRAADVLTYTVNTTAQINAAVAGQPELVTNGTFAANLNDWTNASTGTGTATWSAGAASLVRVDAGNAGIIRQSFTTVAGANYAIAYSAGGAVLKAGVGTSALDDSLSNTTAAAGATTVALFRATGTTTHIYFIPNANSTTATVDNVSVKEVPANSLTLYPLSLWAEVERNALTTAVIQTMSNGASNIAQYYSTAVNILINVTATTLQADQVLGATPAAGVVFKSAARVNTNSVKGVVNGTLGAEDTSVTLPTDPVLWTVGATSANAFQLFGYIRRAAIIQGALTDAQLQTTTS